MTRPRATAVFAGVLGLHLLLLASLQVSKEVSEPRPSITVRWQLSPALPPEIPPVPPSTVAPEPAATPPVQTPTAEVPPPPAPTEATVATVIPSEKKADAAAVSTVPEAPPPPAADVYLPITEVTQMPVLPWKKIRSQLVYPQAARNLGLEGTVVLELTLTADGEIRDIRVLTDPGHGFADAAVAALRGQFASPAFLGDDPVAVRYRVPVKFTLTD